MRRWKTRVRKASGTVATTEAAAICPHGSTCYPAKSAMATGMVRFEGVEMNDSA